MESKLDFIKQQSSIILNYLILPRQLIVIDLPAADIVVRATIDWATSGRHRRTGPWNHKLCCRAALTSIRLLLRHTRVGHVINCGRRNDARLSSESRKAVTDTIECLAHPHTRRNTSDGPKPRRANRCRFTQLRHPATARLLATGLAHNIVQWFGRLRPNALNGDHGPFFAGIGERTVVDASCYP